MEDATSGFVQVPLQRRSQRTLERIAKATEDLLATRSFDDLTIADIVRRARCSTGSFYARFASKDDLLPYLYERYDRDLRPRIEARRTDTPWVSLSLRETVQIIVNHTVDMYLERRHLLRAIALYARSHPRNIGRDVRRAREGATDIPAKLLARFAQEIAHDDPLDAARLGFYMVTAVAREKILFSEAPHAEATVLSDDRLKSELGRTLFVYLTCR